MTALSPLVPRRDWDPAFAHVHPAFAALAAAERFAACTEWPVLTHWNACLTDLALVSGSGAPLTFVPQPPRRRRPSSGVERYECRIFERGEVPSRARNWHDFFNMLCWATFPRVKAALNRRQRAAMARLGLDTTLRLPNARSREQDALALLDEGGCAVLSTVPLGAALARGDDAAVEEAVRAGVACVVVLGHAVYEHLVTSGEVVRALPVEVPTAQLPTTHAAVTRRVDEALAEALGNPSFLAEPPPVVALPMRRALFDVSTVTPAKLPIMPD